VVGVIWVQNSVNFSGASIADIKSVSVNALVLSAVVFTLAAISWLYIKSLLKERKKTSEKMYALQRFKNNQAVFTSLLFRQPVVDTTPWEGDLQLGDPKAPLQLLVACSPYCGPCAQAHFFLHSYLEKKQTGLTIRFAIDTEKREERKTQAVIWLLQLLAGTDQDYKRKVLHDWYTIVDLDKFKNMYPLEQQCNMEDQLFCLKQWNEKVKISFTPTIFINGHQLPPQYSVYDLAAFIGRIDEEMGRAGTEFKKIPGVSALESV
jgi:hypothetical protein